MQQSNLSLVLKYFAGAVVFGVLTFFVYIGKVTADVFESALWLILGALGVHGAYSSKVSAIIDSVQQALPVTTVVTNNTVAEPKTSYNQLTPPTSSGGFANIGFITGMASVLLVVSIIMGCATTTTTANDGTTVSTTGIDTTKVCNSMQGVLSVFSTVATAYDDGTSKTLKEASSTVADICTAGAVVDAKSLANLAQTVIPDLISVTSSLGIPAATKASIIAGLAVAQVAVSAINTQVAATTTNPKVKALLLAPPKAIVLDKTLQLRK